MAGCPFADGKYQLMRNLCFAAALAEQYSPRHDYAFVLAYVRGAPSAGDSKAEFKASREMLLPDVARRVGSIAYETIADELLTAGHGELSEWIASRLRDGITARGLPQSARATHDP
jgi:hypothetical protein